MTSAFKRIRSIDLCRIDSNSYRVANSTLRSWLGGVGLGTLPLSRQSSHQEFDRDSLVISFSPLVGTRLTTSSKFAVRARSPLTGRLTDSLSSTHFTTAGKKTGSDAIVFRANRHGEDTTQRQIGLVQGRGQAPEAILDRGPSW